MEHRYQEGYPLPEDWLLEVAAMRTRLSQQHDRDARLLDQLSNAIAETLRRRYTSAKRSETPVAAGASRASSSR